MLTLTKKQEKQLREKLKQLIEERNMLSTIDKYYGYMLKKCQHSEMIFFKKLNPYTNKFYYEQNLSTTQAKEYFNIK